MDNMCRTRVVSNVNGEEFFTNRGNFAFVTINLPKLAIEANHNIDKFFELLDKYSDICRRYLLFRFELIAKKKVKNFPVTMTQHLYMGSENLGQEDEVRPALKNASLSIGIIGLAETLIALTGKHHAEDKEAQNLGLRIIKHLRNNTDNYTKETHMNFSTFATPAEGITGKLARLLRRQYGTIPGVTDKEWLTNSSHVPVEYNICMTKKIDIEAPYHCLFNAGQIGYIELDGDPLDNLLAFEKIVRYMHDHDMGYFSINHSVDYDPVCGYTGIIKNECPHCHRKEVEVHVIEGIKRPIIEDKE